MATGRARRVFGLLGCLLAVPLAASAQLMSGGTLGMLALDPSTAGPDALTGGTLRAFVSMGQNSSSSASGGSLTLISGVLSTADPARLDLSTLHAFPNPYRPALGHDRVTFRGTTSNTTIRVFTLSGWLVRTLSKNDPTTDDLIWKPVVNTIGQEIASGVYVYFAAGDNGSRKSGKLMVIK